MAVASIADTAIYHLKLGDGPPCLVMHGGLGVDHTQFRAALDPLGDALRLVYYDHRGNGRSGRPAMGTLTLATLADDAEALRRHLGLGKVVVMGHSFGGCVALQYVLRHPESVAQLVLVGTTAAWDYPEDVASALQRRAVPPDVLVAFLDPPGEDTEFARTQRLVAAHLGFHRVDPELAERLYASTVWSAAACTRSRALMDECDVTARLGEIRVPTLILAGRHDVFCPPAQAERLLRGIPGSTLVVFERSGHYPFVEQPVEFRQAVRTWLTQQPRCITTRALSRRCTRTRRARR